MENTENFAILMNTWLEKERFTEQALHFKKKIKCNEKLIFQIIIQKESICPAEIGDEQCPKVILS